MKIFTAGDIRQIDAATIELEPVSSVDLMERAAHKAFLKIKDRVSLSDRMIIFSGTGNNGGDGLAIARMLAEENYHVKVYVVETGAGHSPDMETNLLRLKVPGIRYEVITDKDNIPQLKTNDIIIDSIFGSGLSRPPSGIGAEVIAAINASGASVISVDIPSGLFCDDNGNADRNSIVKASYTITFQFPKLAFMFAGNAPFIGEWEVADIGLHKAFIAEKQTPYNYITSEVVAPMIRKRGQFDHKGTFGHALMIAGSYGKAGAAILSAGAALRTGVGLVTVHVPYSAITAVHSALPEAMISPDPGTEIITEIPEISRYSAIGIGPGLGTDPDTRKAFTELLEQYRKPLVIDADALNILSHDNGLLSQIPPYSILTPHPGEFRRITKSETADFVRMTEQKTLASQLNCIIILKGAHTSVALPDGSVFFNSTGNPGMATAGSGDVLTGIITSLLAQGYSPGDAAIAGVWLHGLAGDIALETESEESLIAGDIIQHIGKAFLKTRGMII